MPNGPGPFCHPYPQPRFRTTEKMSSEMGDRDGSRSGIQKKHSFEEHERRRLYGIYLDHEEEREIHTKKIRKMISYEDFCLRVLEVSNKLSKDEDVAKESLKKDMQGVVAEPEKGKMIISPAPSHISISFSDTQSADQRPEAKSEVTTPFQKCVQMDPYCQGREGY